MPSYVGDWAPSGVCVGSDHLANTTEWCVDNCLGSFVEECSRYCSCQTWGPGSVDALLWSVGGLSALACLVVLGLDLCGPSSGRAPAQAICLHWSNVCNLFYSAYYVFYAIGDHNHPFREPGGMKRCNWAWAGFIGQASCHQHNDQEGGPLCFLNCCVLFVPWLEFFGYGSLLWNIFWLVDLARFTYNPLAPEKLWGLPLKVLYHCLAWPIALAIAVNPDLSRLDTERCRQAEIVMIPCLIRHGSMKQDVPWIHIIGLAIALMAVLVVARRYATTTSDSTPCNSRHVLIGVKPYLRRQWRHAACLAVCWMAILVDTCTKCEDTISSYVTAVFFAGLGFFLGFDRMVTAAIGRAHRRRPVNAQLSEAVGAFGRTATLLSSPSVEHGLSERLSGEGCRGDESEEYRLMDMDTLIAYIVVFLEREQERLKVLSSEATMQSKLASLAAIDDGLPHVGHDVFSPLAPSTFAYLRCLWGVDEERIKDQLLQSQGDLDACQLRTASKSGSSILTAPDGRTFVLKTISDADCRSFQALLPAYRQHIEQHPESLLCQVYGCFSLRNSLGSRLHVALMECLNATPSGWTDPEGDPPTRKTFDIKSEFQDSGFASHFQKGLRFSEDCSISAASLRADYTFLKGLGIVDYSVLLTLWHPVVPLQQRSASNTGRGGEAVRCHRVSWSGAEPGEVSQHGGLASPLSSQGSPHSSMGAWPCKLAVARVGIIDFFQTYNGRKQAESVFKRSLVHPRHPSERVTIVHPELYADRQHDFVMRRVLGWVEAVSEGPWDSPA